MVVIVDVICAPIIPKWLKEVSMKSFRWVCPSEPQRIWLCMKHWLCLDAIIVVITINKLKRSNIFIMMHEACGCRVLPDIMIKMTVAVSRYLWELLFGPSSERDFESVSATFVVDAPAAAPFSCFDISQVRLSCPVMPHRVYFPPSDVVRQFSCLSNT